MQQFEHHLQAASAILYVLANTFSNSADVSSWLRQAVLCLCLQDYTHAWLCHMLQPLFVQGVRNGLA